MKRSILLLILVTGISGLLFSQAVWDKQGVASGTVNEIVKPGGAVLEYFLSTESGVFAKQYPANNFDPWSPDNIGLKDLSIKNINSCYVGADGAMALLADDGVYARITMGPGDVWLAALPLGLLSNEGNWVGYRDASSITIGPNPDPMKDWMIYLSVYGQGIFTKSFCWGPGSGKWCGTGSYSYEEYLDSPSPGSEWSGTTPAQTSPCGQLYEPNKWDIVDTSVLPLYPNYTNTGDYSWYLPDSFAAGNIIDNSLVLSNITLGTNQQLSFYHTYDLDGVAGGSAYHGAVLEISTDGFTWFDLGPNIVAGQYNSTVAAACNPLDSRAAWSGYLLGIGSYNVTVDLSIYSSQTVSFRWRMASDQIDMGTFDGWYIDDITIGSEVEGEWVLLNPPIPNSNVTDLYIDGDGILYASTEYLDGSFPGNIYQLDTSGGSWSSVGVSGVEYLSLGGIPCEEFFAAGDGHILAGSRDNGVYVFNGTNFGTWCGLTPPTGVPAGDFVDVQVYPPAETPIYPYHKSGAVTKSEVFMLDSYCDQPYILFPSFYGQPASVHTEMCVGDGGGGDIYVGTMGTGLFRFQCNLPGAPPMPIGNEGQAIEGDELKTKSVTQLIVADPDTAGQKKPVFLASSLTDGMYKSKFGIWDASGGLGNVGYFVRYFYNPLNSPGEVGGARASCIATPPNYDESEPVGDPGPLTIYLGTLDSGVFQSNDGGASWRHLSDSPSSDPIIDLVISPDFANDQTLFLLTEKANIFRSEDAGLTWVVEAQLNNPSFPLNLVAGFDLVISPSYQNDSVLFAATSVGLFKRTELGIWNYVFSAYPVLSVDVSALFWDGYTGPSTVEHLCTIIGTDGGGIWFSLSNGDSFQVMLPSADFDVIPVVKMHPASDTQDGYKDLMTIFVSGRFSQTGEQLELKYTTYDDVGGGWALPVDIGGQDDYKINSIVYHPGFDRSDGAALNRVYTGHANSKVWYADFGPWIWTQMEGFFSSPPEINNIALKPDEPNIVIAGANDYGVMISFDNGISYYPAGVPINSTNHVVFDVSSVAITDTPAAEYANIVAGTFDNGIFYRNFDSGKTLYYPDPGDPLWDPLWYGSNLSSDEVFDIEYRGPYCEMWAGTSTGTHLSSDLGENWIMDTANGFSSLLESGDCYTPKRSLSGFTWGAKTGVSRPTRAAGDGSAWLKIEEGAWTQQATADLDDDCDYQAIFQDKTGLVSSGTVFLGCGYSTTTPWVRIYRGESCPTQAVPTGTCEWSVSDRGLEDPLTSGIVTAFAKASNGILVGLDESSLGAGDGGVFFTNSHAQGYTWIDVSTNGYAFSCKGSTTLASDGSTIYSGTSCEGSYASTEIDTTTLWPVAYYTWSQDEWNDAKFSFDDKSCCDTHTYNWDFSGDTDTGESVTYNFPVGSEVTMPELTATNDSGSDIYTASPADSIYIANLSGVTFSSGDATVTWERLASDTGFDYELYRDTDPAGATRTLVHTITAGDATWCDATYCWYTFAEAASEVYFRVKVTVP